MYRRYRIKKNGNGTVTDESLSDCTVVAKRDDRFVKFEFPEDRLFIADEIKYSKNFRSFFWVSRKGICVQTSREVRRAKMFTNPNVRNYLKTIAVIICAGIYCVGNNLKLACKHCSAQRQ